MIQVRQHKAHVYLIRRTPDPAGGRADEDELARLDVLETEQLIAALTERLDEARIAEQQQRTEELVTVERRLKEATIAVDTLRRRRR